MDAVISGRSGTALLIDGESLKSFSIDDPTSLAPRYLSDLRLLFDDAIDVQYLRDVNHESVIQELSFSYNVASALDLTLIILDSELSKEIREEAAAVIEGMLDDKRILDRLERILYGQPLPETADMTGAVKCCVATQSKTLHLFFNTLEKQQALIHEVRLAWDSIPVDIFGGEQERTESHYIAITEGVFRDLAKAEDIASYITTLESNDIIRSIPNYQNVLHYWTSQIEPISKPKFSICKSKATKSKPIEKELVIIGGGVTGLLTAVMAIDHGIEDVTVYSTVESHVTESEIIRNHAWLQSSLPYAQWSSLQDLKTVDLALNLFTSFGFMTSDDDWKVSRRLFEKQEKLKRHVDINDYVNSATNRLHLMLGIYGVQDYSFDLGNVIHNLMPIARERGVELETSKVELIIEKHSHTGFLISTGSKLIEPRFAVLCIDDQQTNYLDQLGLQESPSLYHLLSFHHLIDNLLTQPPVDLGSRLRSSNFNILAGRLINYGPAKGHIYSRLIDDIQQSYKFLGGHSSLLRDLYYGEASQSGDLFSRRSVLSQHYLSGYSALNRFGVSSVPSDLWTSMRSVTRPWPSQYPGLITYTDANTFPWLTASEIINRIRPSQLLLPSNVNKERFYMQFVRDKSPIWTYIKPKGLQGQTSKRRHKRKHKR